MRRSTCFGDGDNLHYEKITFQLIGKRLKYSTKTVREIKTTGNVHKDTCLEVKPTPDGFLNVRQGPKMSFKVVAKLLPGQQIKADYQTDEWIHIRMCGEFSDPGISGWVYKKYIEGSEPEQHVITPADIVEEKPVLPPLCTTLSCKEQNPGAVLLPTLREGIVCEPHSPNVVDCHSEDHHTTYGMPKWLLEK